MHFFDRISYNTILRNYAFNVVCSYVNNDEDIDPQTFVNVVCGGLLCILGVLIWQGVMVRSSGGGGWNEECLFQHLWN